MTNSRAFGPLRVSVSGAFSTGKTTLIRAVVERLHDCGRPVSVIGEVARAVLAAGYALDRGATIESYLFYVRHQLAAERMARDAELLISDRSLIDLLAYVLVNDDRRIPREFTDLLAEVVAHETLFFDAYCYLPVEFPPTSDGEREVDPAYQHLVSQRLRGLMDEMGVEVVELRGTVDERARVVIEFLEKRQGDRRR